MVRAITIAGTHSGVGKTSITLGILRAIARRGLQVQPFKVGPDFIDPGHHQRAAGRISHNLDGWMLSSEMNQKLVWESAAARDLAVIEGVMGLFDGYGSCSEDGSTAQIAKWIGSSVILVIDASSLSRSAAALIQGYIQFDPDLSVVGVICNRIGGSSHLQRIREATGDLPVEILGGIPRDSSIEIKQRHLGLWMSKEDDLGEEYIERLATLVETHIDLDRVLELAPPLDLPFRGSAQVAFPGSTQDRESQPVRLGLAQDAAFCFYYAKNLELLEQAGAELISFSPRRDPLPKGLDGLYLGGGYPELYASELASNHLLLQEIREFSQAGHPIYGECGGLIYLSQGIQTKSGQRYPLAGILPFWTQMAGKRTLGYTQVEVTTPNCIFPGGQIARGHRFHYSEIISATIDTESTSKPKPDLCYQTSGWGRAGNPEGYQIRQTLASYVHLHFASNSAFALAFVQGCREQRRI